MPGRLAQFSEESNRSYVRPHRSLGRSYQAVEWILRSLDFVLARKFPDGRIFTERMFAAWSGEILRVSGDKARTRLLCVRKFCLYLARIQPKTFIPDEHTFPRPSAPKAPCLLSSSDVARLVEATRIVRPTPQNPLRRETMRLAILLLYCCGLRSGELFRLRIGDIDVEQRLLRIDHTKFNKSRLVPLSPSLADVLQHYLQQRRRQGIPLDPQSPLVWSSQSGKPSSAFRSAIRAYLASGLPRGGSIRTVHRKPPRFHDLRHSFAVEVSAAQLPGGRKSACRSAPIVALYGTCHTLLHSLLPQVHRTVTVSSPATVSGDTLRTHLLAPTERAAAQTEGVR